MTRRVPLSAAAASTAAVLPAAAAAEPVPDLFSLCLSPGSPLAPGDLWVAWSLAPVFALPLALLLIAYLWDARAARPVPGTQVSPWHRGFFVAGWTLLAVALVSPLCRLAATQVSAHMLQLTLMTVAAPALMALGFSGRAGKGNLPAFGLGLRVGPLPLAAAYGLLIWLWHVPAVYEAVLDDAFVHVTLIGLVIAVSMAFWHSLFDITQRPAAFTALGTTALHTGLLGAILTFAPRAFYPSLAGGTGWSFAPLADQQLAGLIMWVFGGALYLAVAVALAVAWLRELESADRREAAA